jgi:hypothetical protein
MLLETIDRNLYSFKDHKDSCSKHSTLEISELLLVLCIALPYLKAHSRENDIFSLKSITHFIHPTNLIDLRPLFDLCNTSNLFLPFSLEILLSIFSRNFKENHKGDQSLLRWITFSNGILKSLSSEHTSLDSILTGILAEIRTKYTFSEKAETLVVVEGDKEQVKNILTKFYNEHKGGIKSLIEKQNEKEFN